MSVPESRAVLVTEPVVRLVECRLELPGSAPPAGGHPWVVALHGMGQSGAEFGATCEAFRHPRLARAFPDGTFVYEQREASPAGGIVRRRTHAWYVYTGPGDSFARALAEAEAFVTRLVRRLLRENPLDPARGAILGYSQGAYLAGVIAFRHPELFRGGAVLASGRLKDELLGAEMAAAPELPVLVVHGERDRFVPLEFAERSVAALERMGNRRARLVRTPGGHSFSREAQTAAREFIVETLRLDG